MAQQATHHLPALKRTLGAVAITERLSLERLAMYRRSLRLPFRRTAVVPALALLRWTMHNPSHHLARTLLPAVREEATGLLGRVERRGELGWDDFSESWDRMMRRVAFGQSARDNHEISDTLSRLRSRTSRLMVLLRRKDSHQQLQQRIQLYLQQAEPGSLARFMAVQRSGSASATHDHSPEWLASFDPVGVTVYRTLALLSTHPAHAADARQELAADRTGRTALSFIKACVVETMRLWPTTPLPLDIHTAASAARDARFAPERWLHRRPASRWQLATFTAEPVDSPDKQLILLLASAMLGNLLETHHFNLQHAYRLAPARPLPPALEVQRLRFDVEPVRIRK
ncbi:hypothetical protein JNJ66_01415 [Candidatus Saccharibacteria bacterium]|nr:hypothetical protein [Candidatus Saccharibacteria bacterium]